MSFNIFRRSSIRLKSSLTTGHSDLGIIVSDLREVKSSAKSLMIAQHTAIKDIAKWAKKEPNAALNSSFSYILQLNEMLTMIQNEFIDEISRVKTEFELILEGEQSVDEARRHLSACERHEQKLTKKVSESPVCSLEIKKQLNDIRLAISQAKSDVTKKIKENEIKKCSRVKKGLTILTDSNIKNCKKSCVVFESQKSIAAFLPDKDQIENATNIQDIEYIGHTQAQNIVTLARERLASIGTIQLQNPSAPGQNVEAAMRSPPPPYSPPVGDSYLAHNQRYNNIGFNISVSSGYHDGST